MISLVSLAAAGWWASRQGAPTFPSSPASLAFVLAAVLVYAGTTAARGWRWNVILSGSGIVHRARDAYGLAVVGYMGNTILPARGGELLRILLMARRSGARRREVLGTIVAERLLDLLTLSVLFAVLTWSGFAGAPLGQAAAAAAGSGAVLAAAALVVYLRLRRTGRLERFASVVRPFTRASRLLVGRVGAALAALTVAVWAVEGAVLWLIGWSVEIHLSYPEATFLVVLTSLVISIPAAPGYVGTFDAAAIFGLKAFGVHGGGALACALLWRFVVFIPITAVGLALVLLSYGGLPQLKLGARTRIET